MAGKYTSWQMYTNALETSPFNITQWKNKGKKKTQHWQEHGSKEKKRRIQKKCHAQTLDLEFKIKGGLGEQVPVTFWSVHFPAGSSIVSQWRFLFSLLFFYSTNRSPVSKTVITPLSGHLAAKVTLLTFQVHSLPSISSDPGTNHPLQTQNWLPQILREQYGQNSLALQSCFCQSVFASAVAALQCSNWSRREIQSFS